MRRRIPFVSTALLVAGTLLAQGPQWQASLPSVTRAGVHAVLLSPELMGRSRIDLGDIRLLDSLGVEVPYVLRAQPTMPPRDVFVPCTLLRNEVVPRHTLVELERPADHALEGLHIRVRPADVHKRVRVTGSDDRRHWYMVKDDHLAAEGALGDPPYQVLSVPLPRSDYRYFRIDLNDSLTPPMRVLAVGYFTVDVPMPRYTEAAPLRWTQQDSAGITRIHVVGDQLLPIDRLVFAVDDTALFHRNGSIQEKRTITTGRGRHRQMRTEMDQLASFAIGSDLARVIDPGTLRADTFDLVIDNGDDRPLHFNALRAYAIEQLLLAQLEPGMVYQLVTGDPTRSAPQYDLAHFSAQLPLPLDTLMASSPTMIPHVAAADHRFDPGRRWVWAAILVLMAGMGWLAVRLLRRTE